MRASPSPALTTGPADGPKVLMIDNYDSFTWNLVHYLAGLRSCATMP